MTHAPSAPLRRIAAEFLGSGVLAAVVVGSGIAATRLSPSDVGLQLLENAMATALGLFALVTVLGPVSGAHFNPVISLVDVAPGYRGWRAVLPYLPAQVLGCIGGAVLANAMFGLDAVSLSTTGRASGPNLPSEVVATAGLVLVVVGLARSGRADWASAAVAAYIGAARLLVVRVLYPTPLPAGWRAAVSPVESSAPAAPRVPGRSSKR